MAEPVKAVRVPQEPPALDPQPLTDTTASCPALWIPLTGVPYLKGHVAPGLDMLMPTEHGAFEVVCYLGGWLTVYVERASAAPLVAPAGVPEPQGWQPIETAPRDEEVFFWVVPKTPEEAFIDTSGKSIFGTHGPHWHRGRLKTWSSLSKATHWMPLPAPPDGRPSEAAVGRLPALEAFQDGIALIAAERQRQMAQEGWTPDHDDRHDDGELASAAIGYIQATWKKFRRPPANWPWDDAWWKPSPDPVRNLVKAGALIAAEIDRLRRAGLRADPAPRQPRDPEQWPCSFGHHVHQTREEAVECARRRLTADSAVKEPSR